MSVRKCTACGEVADVDTMKFRGHQVWVCMRPCDEFNDLRAALAQARAERDAYAENRVDLALQAQREAYGKLRDERDALAAKVKELEDVTIPAVAVHSARVERERDTARARCEALEKPLRFIYEELGKQPYDPSPYVPPSVYAQMERALSPPREVLEKIEQFPRPPREEKGAPECECGRARWPWMKTCDFCAPTAPIPEREQLAPNGPKLPEREDAAPEKVEGECTKDPCPVCDEQQ